MLRNRTTAQRKKPVARHRRAGPALPLGPALRLPQPLRRLQQVMAPAASRQPLRRRALHPQVLAVAAVAGVGVAAQLRPLPMRWR
jgi:hypothetical protein